MAPQRPYRELTPVSLLGAIVVGAVLNAGIVFAGLQIGFTIVGSTVGAILGFGLLRGILRKGSILEVNVFQTVASSVNTVNAGVIFTVPVLFLLGFQETIDWTALVLATIAGSLLGVVMIIPLRKQIIDYERLRFPSAVAVGAILKSPGAGLEKALLLLAGICFSALVKVFVMDWGGGPVFSEVVNVGEFLGAPAGLRLVFAVSLLSLGAGYLAGRPGLVVLYGTLLNFWVLIPACLALGWVPAEFAGLSFFATDGASYESAESLAHAFRNLTSNKVGIGMILGGALAGILVAAPAMKAALASLRASTGDGGRQEEVGMPVIVIGTVVGSLMLLAAAYLSGGGNVHWTTAILVTLAGVVWLWLSGLVVAQTTGRTDWSPLSGLALIAIAIMMAIMGTGDDYIVPAVTVGAAICVATSMCADMMADLKTGYLVGGMPRKQQIAQILTCWIGPGIALATVGLLWEAYAFGPDQAQILYERQVELGEGAVEAYAARGGTLEALPEGVPLLGAPQAGALQAAIEIVQSGEVPLGKYLTGAALGLAVSLFAGPGVGVMVGLSLYLPFMYMIVFGIGGLLHILVSRFAGPRWAEAKGVPLAAGLIVGDALVGIVNAVYQVSNTL